MAIKVGFIVGKDTDVVEDAKYTDMGGDVSFLADLPDDWRVDPESHQYLKDCEEPKPKGFAHCDVALAWWIHKHSLDIKVDIIDGPGITLERLRSNDINFYLGYNAVSTIIENNDQTDCILQAFREAGNTGPDWDFEEFILQKSRYMKKCMDAGVPMAPTIFAEKSERSPESLLTQIKERGWNTFVMKQSESGFCLGFLKLKVEDCEKDPSILTTYFADYENCPEFIVQEAVEGFTRNWETRCFWYNGKFLYAIANMAAVSSGDGAERIITGDDIPQEFLENAKRIGEQALKCLPDMKVQGGGSVPMILVRTDIGCSDGQMYDKDCKWNPAEKTFFLNEIEPSSTTYFVRHLKFDCIPIYGKLYTETARKAKEQMDIAEAARKAREQTDSSAAAKLEKKRAVENADDEAYAKKARCGA